MFFKDKKNKSCETPDTEAENKDIPGIDAMYEDITEDKKPVYTFYKPDPEPVELLAALKQMIQKLFPETKKAFLLEARHDDKKGYLLIADIEPKFLKIINIYLDGETKKYRADVPIECVLYSKSGTITEGIDPFYKKENASSNLNNLASKEFSGEVVFSDMPEFKIWQTKPDYSFTNTKETTNEESNEEDAEEENDSINSSAKVKPSTKKELFSILNEYDLKKSGEVSTVAMAAIKEYEFYIPYSYKNSRFSEKIDTTLMIDDTLRFRKLINPENALAAVPIFTEKDEALEFAKRDDCHIVIIKYKDFASSTAAELTGFDGIVINPDSECIYLSSSHPLLKQ